MNGEAGRRGASRRRATYAVVAAVLLATLGLGWRALDGSPGGAPDPAADPSSSSSPRAEVAAPVAPAVHLQGTLLRPIPGCAVPATRPFVPTGLDVAGVTRNGPVLALPRDADGVPGTPPISSTGKREYAWDAPGIKPGSAHGNVLMNAHTWPDGTALGNALLAHLQPGDLMRLRGQGSSLCYRVAERLEVKADRAPLARVYDFTGPPRLVMIVCSGRRLGPGNWENRTIWFATPVE